jgi:hypothetical protein
LNNKLTTPVLFLIFNRPNVTQKVFDEIRKAKPPKLFVAADGPRTGKLKEAENCQQARDIIKQVDWDCQVFTLFREKNLGCRKAVSSAVNWFFENVEEGIILEDDCLPDQSFFWFCQEMLEHYRDDTRIMHITGNNFQKNIRGDGSYYFSQIEHCWGWASWRRAWKHYDKDLASLTQFIQQNQIKNITESPDAQKYWIDAFQKVHDNAINSWAYIWTYSIMASNGLCITPNTNIVINIGFGPDATHTTQFKNPGSLGKLEINNIIHPLFILPDKEADNYTFYNHFIPPPVKRKHALLKKILSFIIRG